jgi:CheY-like chemotaxis protein
LIADLRVWGKEIKIMDFFKGKAYTPNKKTILIVDDEEDFCHFVKLNLEQTGSFEVLTASNGQDGIKIAERYQPDLILLDIIMPQMTGTQVAEVLRGNKATKDIPIIFVTAIVKRGEVGSKDYQFGGNYFVFKPVKLDELLSEINAKLV